jgi:hypothetical protein
MLTSFRQMLPQSYDGMECIPGDGTSPITLDQRIVRSIFSAAEDAELRSIVLTSRKHDWQEMSSHMSGGTASQCRERWMNYLSPKLNTAEWTPEEDERPIKKYLQYGNKWTKIAKFFPHRTDGMTNNRFNKLQRCYTSECIDQLLTSPALHLHLLSQSGNDQKAPEYPEQPRPDVRVGDGFTMAEISDECEDWTN